MLVGPDDPVYDFNRLRLLEGEPVSLEFTLMPVNLVPGLQSRALESSVFRYVQEALALKIMGSYRIVRALEARRGR